MRRIAPWLLGLGLAGLLAGCGDSITGDDIDTSGTGRITSSDIELDDGSFADRVRIRPDNDCVLVITMSRTGSDAVEDPYIFVDADGEELTWNDDANDDTLDSRVAFYATGGELYEVYFTTLEADDFGDYDYSIEQIATYRGHIGPDEATKAEARADKADDE